MRPSRGIFPAGRKICRKCLVRVWNCRAREISRPRQAASGFLLQNSFNHIFVNRISIEELKLRHLALLLLFAGDSWWSVPDEDLYGLTIGFPFFFPDHTETQRVGYARSHSWKKVSPGRSTF